MAEKISSIQVSENMRIKLNIMKQQLGCKSIEELIERILKIVPASELKKQNKK